MCRFCGRNENETLFNQIANALPELIGNKSLITNYECDECNNFFGTKLESDYAKFFMLWHSIMGVEGKKGIPIYTEGDNNTRIEEQKRRIVIKQKKNKGRKITQ